MFETTRIFHCRSTNLQKAEGVFVFLALVLPLFATPVWGSTLDNAELAKTLSTSVTVHPDARKTAIKFLQYTLPKLASKNPRAAKQLGFRNDSSQDWGIDETLPTFIINMPDLLKYVRGESNPMGLINNSNNWTKDSTGHSVPRRVIYVVNIKGGSVDLSLASWTSVTVEESLSGNWRVFQAGAPRLSRALKLYATQPDRQFLLWFPDLNRHYLGRCEAAGPIFCSTIWLTALFNDPVAERSAGEEFNITSKEFIEKLKQLYERLQLPKQSQSQHSQSNGLATSPKQ